MAVIFILYLAVAIAYSFAFYKHGILNDYGALMFLVACISWPAIFVGTLLAVPFLTFMKFIGEDDKHWEE